MAEQVEAQSVPRDGLPGIPMALSIGEHPFRNYRTQSPGNCQSSGFFLLDQEAECGSWGIGMLASAAQNDSVVATLSSLPITLLNKCCGVDGSTRPSQGEARDHTGALLEGIGAYSRQDCGG